MNLRHETQDLKTPRRNAYTRSARRAAQREIDDALDMIEQDKNIELAFDTDALDAITGLAPDWML